MKKIILVLALLISSVGFGCNLDSDRQSISIQKDESNYSFVASFPKKKTAKVLVYMEETLKEKLFSDKEGVKNQNFALSNKMKFHLASKPGFIEIDFKRSENSYASFNQLEKLCLGIKGVLSN